MTLAPFGGASVNRNSYSSPGIITPVDPNSICEHTLNKYTNCQLRRICKLMKLKGYSKLKKLELLQLIQNDLNKD